MASDNKDQEAQDADPDEGLEEAWERSQIGIRVNPKRYIKGLVYTHDDKKENCDLQGD